MTTQLTDQDHDFLESLSDTEGTVEVNPESELTETPKEPSITGMTVAELSASLTGFDEIGIAKHFGEMSTLRGSMAARALIFVHISRSGVPSDDAYKQAMELRQDSIDGHFEVDDEITPDEPETESGKDSSLDVAEPTT